MTSPPSVTVIGAGVFGLASAFALARRGSFATYTAAGHVRRALTLAGFEVQRRPGFGRKRHMSIGRLIRPA